MRGLRLIVALLVALALMSCPRSAAGLEPNSEKPCHRRAQEALIRGIERQPVLRGDLKGCWGLLTRKVPGSENVPILSTAAAVVAGIQDPEDLRPLLRGLDPWPPGEICSEIYGSWIALAILTVHNRLERPEGFRRVTRRYLRAFWTLLTLSAATEPPERIEVLRPGEASRIRNVRIGKYQGAWTHCPGMRSTTRGDDAYWSDRTDLHPLLSAALGLDWQPRRPLVSAAPGEPQWVLWWTQELAERRRPTAEFWGLKDRERHELRDCLASPSVECARRLVRWLAPLRPQPGIVRTLLRLEEGGVVALQNVETNRVKATQHGYVIAAQAQGVAYRVAARYAHVGMNEIRAWSSGAHRRFPLEPLGQELFRIVGTPKRWWVLPPPKLPIPNPKKGVSP